MGPMSHSAQMMYRMPPSIGLVTPMLSKSNLSFTSQKPLTSSMGASVAAVAAAFLWVPGMGGICACVSMNCTLPLGSTLQPHTRHCMASLFMPSASSSDSRSPSLSSRTAPLMSTGRPRGRTALSGTPRLCSVSPEPHASLAALSSTAGALSAMATRFAGRTRMCSPVASQRAAHRPTSASQLRSTTSAPLRSVRFASPSTRARLPTL
mmetsp:Transcript_25800/g.60236  ORF Transcript_25800/g.60236 Transcript_25800/m.60236 type:complete len:208 (-) Transcript_25800:13-636(-)